MRRQKELLINVICKMGKHKTSNMVVPFINIIVSKVSFVNYKLIKNYYIIIKKWKK